MKPRFEHKPDGDADSDVIRSEIARTREKMDHTLDEISHRMTPKHLLDEVLDFFRSHRPDGDAVKQKAGEAAGKAGDAASRATHAVVDAIRQHPLPALLIGAGIACALYESRREESEYYESEDDLSNASGGAEAVAGGGATSTEGDLKSASEKVQEKLGAAGEQLREKGQQLRERAGQQGRAIREKAGQYKRRMAEGAQRSYAAGRDKIIETSEAHPLTTGLGLLALGVLAGLALPRTPQEDRWIGPAADKVKGRAREQGREYVERGKRVATAAVETAKREAQEQGFTPEALKEKAQQVASETKAAAQRTAEEEGFSQPQGAATLGSGSQGQA